MKEWKSCDIVELDIKQTEKQGNMGNNDTHTHKGWCLMHKNPEFGICTCGASVENGGNNETDGLS